MNPRGRGLVWNEEQGMNKMIKSIVVKEQKQEQEQEEGSETRFVDLDEDTLHSVLKRVDVVTLGRAACVNKLWRKVAVDERLWDPIVINLLINSGTLEHFDTYRNRIRSIGFHTVAVRIIGFLAKPPPLDFYLIDPQVFSGQIGPFVQEKYKPPVEVEINRVLHENDIRLLWEYVQKKYKPPVKVEINCVLLERLRSTLNSCTKSLRNLGLMISRRFAGFDD